RTRLQRCSPPTNKGRCECSSSKLLQLRFWRNKALLQIPSGLGITSWLRGTPGALRRTIDYCFSSSRDHRTASSGKAPPTPCNDQTDDTPTSKSNTPAGGSAIAAASGSSGCATAGQSPGRSPDNGARGGHGRLHGILGIRGHRKV